jgi:radical SAM superfamily enzyme YgiQ (UPF0313 family)
MDSVFLAEPLHLEYIGAGIQAHHDVKVLDLRIPSEPGIKETLETFQPDIIACTAYTVNVYRTREICAEAKKVLPGILTVVGGHHPYAVPEDFFEDYIDVIAVGEGVEIMGKICERHEQKKSFEDIDNIYFRKDGKMVFTNRKEHPPLDTLPLPARNLTAHIRHKYLNQLIFKAMPVAMVRGSLGCFFHCKFCAVTHYTNGKLYRRSIERIVEELASIDEPFIFWCDDEFFLEPERVILLAKEIEKAGIKKTHALASRTDTIVKHPECVEAWAKVGLKVVFVGMEAFRDKDLKTIRKGTTISKNEECINILHKNNIIIRGGFIVYQDYEKEDFKRLGEYVRKSGVDIPTFTILTPLPGTDLYKETKDQLITHNYNLFDLTHTVLPTKLPLKKFYNEYSTLLYRRSMTFKRRIEMFRRLDPQNRKEFISVVRKAKKKLENAYKEYNLV